MSDPHPSSRARPVSVGWFRTLVPSVGAITAGSMVANLCAYLVHLPAGRWLGPAAYSEFAVLLAAMLVLAVPALALQAVIAREVVHGRDLTELRRLTARVTGVVVVLAVPGTALLMWLADTGWQSTIAGLSAAPVLAMIAGGQGILQGARKFSVLAVILAVVGVLRSVPVVVVLAVGGGPTAGLWAATIGAGVAALIVWVAVRRSVPHTPPRSPAATAGVTDVGRAGQVQLILVLASSLDLLVARTVLDESNAGIYALGAIATKAAFWLPQAVGVVFYPALADPTTSRRSLGQALKVVAVVGAVVTVGAGVAGPLVPLVVSEDYRPLVGILWLFAYTGSVLAVLQVALLWAIARDRTAVATIAWAVVVVEVIVIAAVADSVLSLALIAAAAATVSTVVTVAWLRPSRLSRYGRPIVAADRSV